MLKNRVLTDYAEIDIQSGEKKGRTLPIGGIETTMTLKAAEISKGFTELYS